MSVKVTDRDTGFSDFVSKLKTLNDVLLSVGIQRPEANNTKPNGITLDELAAIHEFGAPGANVPSRSFVRATADRHQNTYFRQLEKISARVVENPKAGKPTRDMLALGDQVLADMQGLIDSDIPPPLTSATLAEKSRLGFPSTALIRTRELRDSLTRKVVKK